MLGKKGRSRGSDIRAERGIGAGPGWVLFGLDIN